MIFSEFTLAFGSTRTRSDDDCVSATIISRDLLDCKDSFSDNLSSGKITVAVSCFSLLLFFFTLGRVGLFFLLIFFALRRAIFSSKASFISSDLCFIWSAFLSEAAVTLAARFLRTENPCASLTSLSNYCRGSLGPPLNRANLARFASNFDSAGFSRGFSVGSMAAEAAGRA